jgi:hypothetical protein
VQDLAAAGKGGRDRSFGDADRQTQMPEPNNVRPPEGAFKWQAYSSGCGGFKLRVDLLISPTSLIRRYRISQGRYTMRGDRGGSMDWSQQNGSRNHGRNGSEARHGTVSQPIRL